MNYYLIKAYVNKLKNKLKPKNMIKLEDLMEMEGLYYIGEIIDTDGSEWVSKEEARCALENSQKRD